MKFVLRLVLFAAVLTIPFAVPATAQYMYLDANANGVHDSGDRLNANGTATTVDLFVQTNTNRDGSTAVCDTGPEPLTINQYQINLLAVGGTVTYSNFINQQAATMTFAFGEFNPDGVRYKNGFGGGTQLPVGTYRLCTLTITGATGSPRIDIVDQVSGSPDFTGFGTSCIGRGFDNVYRLDGPNVPPQTGDVGDFTDADGLGGVAGGNTPPAVTNPGNRTVSESVNLAFTATATDPDAGQTITWSLSLGTPAATGATIGAATGAFSWTPTEAQGPGVYPVTITATDNATPTPGSGDAAFTITVNEVNEAPVLAAIGNKTVAEGTLLTFTATATDADLPANLRFFSLDIGAPAGATINGGTGIFTWTPTEAEGPGTYPITIRVADNGTPSLDDFETIQVAVTEANVAPVLAAIGNKSGTAGTLLTFTATATDADLPANTLTFSLDAGAPAGAVINGSTGVFSWTPATNGTFPVTVRVTDNGTPALSDFEAITITVAPGANQPPVLTPIGAKTINELATLTFTATANDPDAGQTLTFRLGLNGIPGATMTPAGAFSWTPTEAQGPGNFVDSVFVTDNGVPALSDFETVPVTVNEVNTAPVLAAIGPKSATVGTALTFTATATDADLPALGLIFSLDAGAPAGATIGAGTGAFSWTPSSGQVGSNAITVRVTDNGTPPLSDFELVMVDVAPAPNVAPVLGAIGDKTVAELATLTFTATATDADVSQTLTFTLDAGAPAGATIGALTGAFSWTPTEAQGPGSYPITVRVTDNGTPALNDFELINVTVNEANVAPVLGAIGNKTVDELATLNFTATATDADLPANTLTFSLDAGAPAGAVINPSVGVFSWTPNEAQGPGTYPVTIRVTDNGTPALNDFEAITITVNEVNTAPVLAGIGDKATTVGVAVTFTATATDADLPANSLTFSLDVGAPAGATINGGTGAFSWTPSANGTFPVTIRVTDNGTAALSDFEAISIVVSAAPNQAPVLGAIGNKTVNEEVNLSFTATATDPDAGQTLTFSLDAGAPAGATINGATGAFSWTPTEAQGPGPFPITVSVTDDGTPNISDSETITVTVNEVNVAPVLASIGNKAGTVGVELTFTATATDADVPFNLLTFSLDAGAPAGATINGATGGFSWTPGSAGTFPVTVRVTDDGTPSLDDFEVISIDVGGAANQAPVLDAIGNKTVNELTSLAFTATATDPDGGQTLSFSLDSPSPAGATIDASTGAFSWTPTETQGPVVIPITVRVTDNGSPALSDFESIAVAVLEVNQAPVLAAIGDKAGSVGVEVAFTATATDADIPANALAFSLDAGAPAGATINATSGAFSWTPASAGSFPVTVRVTDDGTPALDDFEVIAINVSAAANEPPVLAAIGNKTVNELENLAFTATATDPDQGQTLAFSLDSPVPAGATIDASTGAFSWTPTEAQGPGVIPITVRVTDNGSPELSDIETIAVAILEVNEAPVLAAIGDKAGSVGVAVTFTASATDADIPANSLAFSLDAGAPAGATINASTGAFSWTPGSAGSFPVTVRVTDDGTPALDDFEVITINVSAAANQAPVLAAIGDKTVDELTALTFTATATDPDASQTLTFSLDAGAPSGASITAGGAFSWTPSEIDGPDTFPITVRVTDNGSPALDDFEAITVTVNEVNESPTLAPIGNKGGVVGAAISFKATATDNDIPTNEMTFSLDAPVLDGATIDPTTGDFSWTPQGPGIFYQTVRVTDNGVPALFDLEQITINVEAAANNAPVLAAIGNKTVDELAALTFTATATDADASQTLTFSLDSGSPAGAAITAGGSFSWTPTEAQGPGAFPITVRVTDNGTPAMDDFETITVTVNEVNVAPVLAAIGNKSATVGVLLAFTASATDADIPANTLTFSLDAGAPSGATIGASSGVFNWTPGATGTFSVTVRVTDNGTPSMSDFETIQITVSGAETVAAHAFFFGLDLLTILESADPFTCVQIEPVRGSYSNNDVNLSSIVMKYAGKQITASADRSDIDGDKNNNGVREIRACFSKPDLRYLFGGLSRGLHLVQVAIEADLTTGARLRDPQVFHFVLVIGNRCDLVASPNPMNPETVLRFTTTQSGPVTIRVYDIAGRLVKTLHDGTMPAGLNQIRWDGSTENGNRVATGVYFVKMKTRDGDQNLRITVLK
jgi:flagellar hook capping protein FlgD/putative Ig domain-containing protein